MAAPPSSEITSLLLAWSQGNADALHKLVPLVYQELHRLAHRYMRAEDPDHSLQTTALINEVYLRLVHGTPPQWQSRAHFFAVCAQVMRRILVDFARSRRYLKRGGGARPVSLEEAPAFVAGPSRDFLALDEALNALAAVEPRKSRVVELRFFGGLTVEETAEVLQVSPDTVLRDWRLAKAWLRREMKKASSR